MPYSWPVDLDDVKAKLNKSGTSSDAELQRVIDFATAVLENHPAYRIADYVKSGEWVEDFDGGSDTIVLSHAPVTGTPTVTEYSGGAGTVIASEPITTAAFTAYGYRLRSESGIVKRTADGYSANWSPVQVIYTTGDPSDVPADIYSAALEFIEHLWEDQRGGGTSRPMVGMDPDFDREVVGRAGYLLPNRVAEALAAYRREPRVGAG